MAACRSCSEEQLQAAMAEVNKAEDEASIGPWSIPDAPEQLIAPNNLPQSGSVTSRLRYSGLDATELILSNGMRVRVPSRGFAVAFSLLKAGLLPVGYPL